MRLKKIGLIGALLSGAPGVSAEQDVSAVLAQDASGRPVVHVTLFNLGPAPRFVEFLTDFDAGAQVPQDQCRFLERDTGNRELIRETSSAGLLIPAYSISHRLVPLDPAAERRCRLSFEIKWEGTALERYSITVVPRARRLASAGGLTRVEATRLLVERDIVPHQYLLHALVRAGEAGRSRFAANLESLRCGGAEVGVSEISARAEYPAVFSNASWRPLEAGWSGAVFLVRLDPAAVPGACVATVRLWQTTAGRLTAQWTLSEALDTERRFTVFFGEAAHE